MLDLVGQLGVEQLDQVRRARRARLADAVLDGVDARGLEASVLDGQPAHQRREPRGDAVLEVQDRVLAHAPPAPLVAAPEHDDVARLVPALAGDGQAQLPVGLGEIDEFARGDLEAVHLLVHPRHRLRLLVCVACVAPSRTLARPASGAG